MGCRLSGARVGRSRGRVPGPGATLRVAGLAVSEAVVLLAQVLDALSQGQGVVIIPKEVELTTQQAADMLNVSRPYLIGLLESGKIPYRKVGRHRRITFEALTAYRRRDDLERRAAADDLADLSQELGLY